MSTNVWQVILSLSGALYQAGRCVGYGLAISLVLTLDVIDKLLYFVLLPVQPATVRSCVPLSLALAKFCINVGLTATAFALLAIWIW